MKEGIKMTRITYKKENNLLINRNDLIAIDKFLEVRLDPVNLFGIIVNKGLSEQIGGKFEAKNLPALKKAAKLVLETLGVNFNPEVRPRVKNIDEFDESSKGLNKEFNNEMLKD